MNFLNDVRSFISYRKSRNFESNTSREGAFVTWQALITFPVSTSAISVTWRVLQNVDSTSTIINSMQLPLILSFVFGMVFFLLDITDEQNQDRSINTVIRKLILAIVNSFFLAAAAMGINSTL